MRIEKTLLGLSALALAPAVRAQTVQGLVSEGDTVIGVGAVTSFNPQFVGVTDSGMWTIVVDTDFVNIQEDVALLRNGFVTLREGASMIEPSGAVLNQFLSVDLANNGNLGMNLSTRTPTTTGNVYWNLIRVANLDDAIPSADLGANSKWMKFEVVKLNSSNQIFVLGEINNTAVTGNREDALIRYDLGPLGNVLSLEVLLTKDQFNETLGTTITGTAVSPTEHVLAVNKHGDWITYVGGFGVNAVMVNGDTVVAQELEPSSQGRVWRSNGLGLTKVAINDFGDYVVTGALEPVGSNDLTTYLIEKNGQKFVRAGEVIPTYSTSPIAAGRAGPIFIANTGDVFWRAETQAGEASYMRNFQPIVKSGTTSINGNLITDLPPNEHSFTVSPDGRFLLGRIQSLQTIGESSVFVDFGVVVEIPGCAGNPGRLFKTSGDPRIGETFQLAMDDGQEPGVLPIISFSTQPRLPGSDCGVNIPAGELLISPTNRVANLFLPTWNGSNPTAINIAIPDTAALIDLKLWAQGFFRDVTGPSTEPTRLTNGLRIEVGAP